MFEILFLLLVLPLLNGLAFGLFALFVAVLLFLIANSIEVNFQSSFLAILMVSSFPLAAYIAGMLLDRFANYKLDKFFSIFLLVISSSILLTSDLFYKQIDHLYSVLNTASALNVSAFVIELFTTVAITASLSAIILMIIVLLIELPLCWFISAQRIKFDFCLAALRPLLLIILLSFGSSYILDFFIAEFENV